MITTNKNYGTAILLMIALLALTGCQPVSTEQPTATSQPTAIPQPTATSTPTATPQPTDTPLPTATPTPQPTATLTATPTEIVVAEGEVHCPLLDFKEDLGFGKIPDPVMGHSWRALIQEWRFDCADPEVKETCISLSDIGTADSRWSGLIECVSDEGGVWKGSSAWVPKPEFLSSENLAPSDFISIGNSNGEGLYEGLRRYTEYDQGTSMMKYRIIKTTPIEQMSAPTAASTMTVVAEVEANCQVKNYKEGKPLALVNDPELGKVARALLVRWELSCTDPYLSGKYVSIQDAYQDAPAQAWTGFSEGVIGDYGVWKGSCAGRGKEKPTRCTYHGEGMYKGLQIFIEFDMNANYVKYRLLRQAQE